MERINLYTIKRDYIKEGEGMKKLKKIFSSLWFVLVFLMMMGSLLGIVAEEICCAEEISITTYYPAPNGVYDRMMVNRLGVGDNNDSGQLDNGDVPATSGNVWIKGKVGIGVSPESSEYGLYLVGEGQRGIFLAERHGRKLYFNPNYSDSDIFSSIVFEQSMDFSLMTTDGTTDLHRLYIDGSTGFVGIGGISNPSHPLEIHAGDDQKVLLTDTSAAGKKLQLQVGSSHGVVASDGGLLFASYSNLAGGSPSYQSGLWIGAGGGSEFYGDLRIKDEPVTGTAGGLELGGERMERWLAMQTMQIEYDWAWGPIGGDYTFTPDQFGLRSFRGAHAALNGFTEGFLGGQTAVVITITNLTPHSLTIHIGESGMTHVRASIAALGEPL